MTKPRAEHDLEKAVPFLLARAGARMGNAFARALKKYGLSLTEWRVCASLAHTPDQTLSELSLHAAADLSALSRIVDRLVARRLANRRRAQDDKRAVLISLTPRGTTLTHEIVPLARHYESVALADFKASEVRALREMLERLYQNATPLL
jgi:MarR family transcriptional regulator, organic hydroperoxide resistance regulator